MDTKSRCTTHHISLIETVPYRQSSEIKSCFFHIYVPTKIFFLNTSHCPFTLICVFLFDDYSQSLRKDISLENHVLSILKGSGISGHSGIGDS